ncbi:hypothetical protein AB0N17_24250 [Streptomyces sp. NPDC051133]|uniref:hypothetical protein n=1 Tax=Streptomyces sp. NPDC051133 TaxID=3155521 RepID=UPI0034151256
MSGTEGKDLKATGLNLIAQGITQTLDELKELGIDSWAGAGRGFSDMELSGLELGHDDLTGKFKSFCERWEWGVRALVAEGNAFAQGVGLSAGTFYETDQYVSGTLKVGVNSLIGNPDAAEADVEKMSYGDIAKSGAFGGADYSKESFDQAWANSKQGWMDADRDFMTSQAADNLGLRPAGMSDAEYNQVLDETFGPSPEARAEAAGQQGGED